VPPPDLERLLVQLQYPAMTWVESRITEAWLRAHGAEYDAIDFNVRLGEGQQLGEEYSPETRRMAQLVTQLRADLVARRASEVTLIEVKVRVGLPVIGQLIGYRHLWNQAHPEAPVTRLLAIGRSVVAGLEGVLAAAGVEVELFERE